MSAGGRVPLRVAVVTYNSEATLAACLDSVAPQVEALGGQLVVVDNGSRDASVEVARDRGATVIEAGRNLGFAAGCNLAMQDADGELLVTVNPDSELDPDCLAGLLAVHRATPDAGPIGGRARHPDGRYDDRGVLGLPRLRGALAFAVGLDAAFRGSRWLDPEHGPSALPESDTGTVPVEAVSGAVMGVPRELWERLGGLDERYFLYGEDVDLCLRAHQEGWQPVVALQAGYRHVGGMSADGSHLRRVLLHRGKVELYRHHLSPFRARVAVWALQVGAALRGAAAVGGRSLLARRAAPWRELFRARRTWRCGHGLHARGR